jgi:predicted nucleic acid-binding protein
MTESFELQKKGWFIMNVDEAVVFRASRDFPIEPVRSLDALHLATALEYQKLYPHCRILSLDKRIRENADALGM